MKLLDLILNWLQPKPKLIRSREMCVCGKRITVKKNGVLFKHVCQPSEEKLRQLQPTDANVRKGITIPCYGLSSGAILGICGPGPTEDTEEESENNANTTIYS